jgi:hypothetical protein
LSGRERRVVMNLHVPLEIGSQRYSKPNAG